MNFMNNNIVVLCGYQGSGKDSLASLLQIQGYEFIISHTTRPMRCNETQGNPYHFISKEEFLSTKDDFIEYRSYNTLVDNIPETWYYGVKKGAVKPDKKYVVVLDKQGLEDFKKEFGNRVKSFYIEVNDDIRKQRAIARGSFDETEFNRREIEDKKNFKGIETEFIVKNNEELIDSFKYMLNVLKYINYQFSYPEIQKLFKAALTVIPKHFYQVGASSTGKRHVSISHGYGGLLIHSLLATDIARDLCEVYNVNRYNKEIIILATLLHDISKRGNDEIPTPHSLRNHPSLAVEQLNKVWEDNGLTKLVKSGIVSHMGQWGNYPVKTLIQEIVHISDYLSSRKTLDSYFNQERTVAL